MDFGKGPSVILAGPPTPGDILIKFPDRGAFPFDQAIEDFCRAMGHAVAHVSLSRYMLLLWDPSTSGVVFDAAPHTAEWHLPGNLMSYGDPFPIMIWKDHNIGGSSWYAPEFAVPMDMFMEISAPPHLKRDTLHVKLTKGAGTHATIRPALLFLPFKAEQYKYGGFK